MRTAFESQGEIRGTDILASLVALWREAASGSLQFQRSGATAGFELAAGEIVGASSSDLRFDTAAILVRAGKLEAATLERLSASEGMDRAMTALQAGVLTRREWRWGEKIRAVEVLSDLLTWIEGDYTFFRSAAREAGEFRLTIPRLVLELFLRSRDRGLVLHHLGGVDVPLVRDSRFDAEFSTFGLTDDAESVVRLIDGDSTAAEIASEAPADTFAVEKLLAALVTLGLVHPAYTAGESDSAARESAAPRPEAVEPVEPAPAEDTTEEPEEEELEPEVDVEEKEPAEAEDLALLAEPAAPDEDWDVADEHRPEPDTDRDEALVDAPLAAGGEADDFDERTERLASDFDGGAEIPGDLMEPDARGPSDVPAFDRPLDATTGVGSLERPEHRSTSPLLWVLVILVAIVAGVLYWRARGPSGSTESMAAAPSPSPTFVEATIGGGPFGTPVAPAAALPTAAPATGAPARATVAPTFSAPTPAPTRRAPTAVPSKSAPTAAPTRRAPTPAPTKPAAAPRAQPPTSTAAVPHTRKQWLDRAARDQKTAAADRNARFAIQLELACEIASLREAWGHDRPGGSMWVATTSYRGRTCFKVLWGRYETPEEAAQALPSAPGFFSTSRNHPMVVSIR